MKNLKERWNITSKRQIVLILVVFAVTGSTSAYIGKPLLKHFNINYHTFSMFAYWVIYIILLFFVYPLLLVFFGWLFGQFNFFWNFQKKILYKLGLRRLLE